MKIATSCFDRWSRKVLMALLMMMTTSAVMAVPAKRGQWKMLKLQDGTEVRAMLVGDEYGHYWRSADGMAYARQADADFYEAVDAEAIIRRAEIRRSQVNAKRVRRLAARRTGEVTYTGAKKALMLLVNFKDTKFKTGHDNALFCRIANEQGYSEGDFKGSMADYFRDQSRGQFELDFDVVGPLQLSKAASYYGQNNKSGDDMHAGEMVGEAVGMVKDSIGDWTAYDWNNDGFVDQVYVVYAGKGEADGGSASTIWPHAYDLNTSGIEGDGEGMVLVDTALYVNSYACGSELNGQGEINGIGTMCHEYSHCLGYPDFYDINYKGGQGMGTWDLMDVGSYNGDGYQPAGYTSYERWVAGWLEPVELNAEDVSVSNMKSLQNDGECYIIYNKGNNNEFLLLENRQLDGWDASLTGAGLLILHCDYDERKWLMNEPNGDPNHQRMVVIPADGECQYYMYMGDKYYTDEGDAFPQGNVTAYNMDFAVKSTDKQAVKAAQFFNKNINGTYWIESSVENIKQHDDGSVSFDYVANYDGGNPDQPGIETILFYESFNKCDDKGGNDNMWSGQIANGQFVPDSVGWVAEKSFGAFRCAKFGTAKDAGAATTPVFAVNGTGRLTFKAGAWKARGDGTTLHLSVSNGDVSPSAVEMDKGAFKDFEATITATGDVQVTFAAEAGRFFLDEVLVKESAATAIRTVKATDRQTTRIYTLDGRHAGSDFLRLGRGIYIINGKKVVK